MQLEIGDLIFIRPADQHAFEVGEGGRMTFINVAFLMNWFDRFRRLWPQPGVPVRWLKQTSPPAVRLDAADRESLEQAAAVLAATQAPRHLALARFCLEACTLLARPAELRTPCPLWLLRVVAAMESAEAGEKALAHFQRMAGRTPEHFSRTCRRYYGLTPSSLLNRTRVRQAQAQLVNTDAKVIDVAYGCGFTNLGYFNRQFLRFSGCTPRAWRRRHAAAVPR